MRKTIAALAMASSIAACANSTTGLVQVPAVDSCAMARPDFGGPATASDRSLFTYDVDAPLNLQKTVESTSNGVEVSTISFDSPGGGRATGMLFNPHTRSSLRPGVVLMHGLPGTARQTAGFGTGLAQDGAVVIAIDAPFARRSGQAVLFTTQDRAEQIQLIQDLQRAVDVLRGVPNVDAGRIAYHGTSYGGAMGALFVGIERRLKTAVLVVPDGGLVSHFTGPEDMGMMSQLSCATRAAWFRAMTPIEPIRFIAHANATLLVQNGRTDQLVPAADAELLHQAAPSSSTLRWYDAGHGLNQQAFFDRLDWLTEQVGLDAGAGR
jgi:dienelactone hydrolase